MSWRVAQPPQIASGLLSQLRYRYIGPVGNRVIAAAGIPGDPNVYYAGTASGGIFKSADGGIYWDPVFDGQPVSSVGSLAVAPFDPSSAATSRDPRAVTPAVLPPAMTP